MFASPTLAESKPLRLYSSQCRTLADLRVKDARCREIVCFRTCKLDVATQIYIPQSLLLFECSEILSFERIEERREFALFVVRFGKRRRWRRLRVDERAATRRCSGGGDAAC